MSLRLIQFSAVVVGHAHNPTILNPDFLSAEGIVPKSWGWEVQEAVTTPALSLVRYSGGVTITVEPTKLHVADSAVEAGPRSSKVVDITGAFVRVLRHVRYSAIGNNFQGVVEHPSPGQYLSDRFLRHGPWSENLEAAGIRLVYPIDDGHLRLSFDQGTASLSESDERHDVIFVDANFNRNCVNHPGWEQIAGFSRKFESDWSRCQQLVADTLP